MQTVILAAGRGVRLAPVTDTIPKAMVTVAGQPLIERIVRQCVAVGQRDLIIVVGYMGNTVRAHLGNGSAFGADIQYVEQGELGGTGHAARAAAHLITGDFLLIFGDSLLPDGRTIAAVRDTPTPGAVGVAEVDNPSRYGIVSLSDAGLVTSIIEKPVYPPTNLAVMALYKLPLAILDALLGVGRSSRGEIELPDAVRILLADGVAFTPVTIAGVMDIGTPPDLIEANRITAPVEMDEVETEQGAA